MLNHRTDERTRVCIVQPCAHQVSETFLRAHAELLPAEVSVVVGGRPRMMGESRWATARLVRAYTKLSCRLRGASRSQEVTQHFLHVLPRTNPDVVLAEYGPTGVSVMEACRRLQIPLVAHFHGADASQRQVLEQFHKQYQQLFQQAAAVVAVSNAMRTRLIDLGADADKVHYNPCGVSCEQFAGAAPAQAMPVFVAVGRFVDKKSPHFTIQAFAQVHRRHPDARLRMIGTGPHFDSCKELARRLGVEQAVAFLGAQPHRVVQQEMQAARAFVQHSAVAPCGDSEGTPVSVLEASASGLPVISTRHGGIPDVVLERETGLLVDERDVVGMAAQMQRMVVEPELAARLGRAGRLRVQQHFSHECSIQRLWGVLRTSVAAARQQSPGSRHQMAA